MKPRQRGAAWLHALVLALASCAGPPFAPPPERDRSGLPTVEWIHGAEREALDRVPAFQWLEDGSLLLYDAGAAPEDPALECFDPDSGRRSRWLALARAIGVSRRAVRHPARILVRRPGCGNVE